MTSGSAAARSRVRVPIVLQMEFADCGAASLGMVLAAHGRHVPLEELREACGVSTGGASAAGILAAARAYGLLAKGFRARREDLENFPLPAIAFWDMRHFLVVTAIERDRLRLHDPALGPRDVTPEEFERGFSGVLLAFEPGESFRTGGDPSGRFRFLFREITALAPTVLLGAARGGLLATTSVLLAELLASIGAPDRTLDARAAVLVASLAACWLALQGFGGFVGSGHEGRIAKRAEIRLDEALRRLPPRFFERRMPGELDSRRDLARFRAPRAAIGVAAASAEAMAILALLGYLVALDPLLAGLLAPPTLLFLVLGARCVAGSRVGAEIHGIGFGRLQGFASAWLGSWERLQLARKSHALAQSWIVQHGDVIRRGGTRAFVGCLSELLAGSYLGVVLVLVAGRAASTVAPGEGPPASLVASGVAALSMTFLFGRFLDRASRTMRDVSWLTRLEDSFVLADPRAPAIVAPRGPRLESIEVRGLGFRYDPSGHPALAGIDLDWNRGTWIAVVGPAGSGKSTLARLLAGLERPSEGTIRFVPGATGEADSRAREGGVVLVEVGEKREFLQDGLAVLASAGESQRAAIDAALQGSPSFLVLDLGTTAIDPDAELAIREAIRSAGVGCLVTDHTSILVPLCDEIFVLEAGRLAERGTHDRLVAAGGAYERLLRRAEVQG